MNGHKGLIGIDIVIVGGFNTHSYLYISHPN